MNQSESASVCNICNKTISKPNYRRHVDSQHRFCFICNDHFSAKKHSCFNKGEVKKKSGRVFGADDVVLHLPFYLNFSVAKALCGVNAAQTLLAKLPAAPYQLLLSICKNNCIACFDLFNRELDCFHSCQLQVEYTLDHYYVLVCQLFMKDPEDVEHKNANVHLGDKAFKDNSTMSKRFYSASIKEGPNVLFYSKCSSPIMVNDDQTSPKDYKASMALTIPPSIKKNVHSECTVELESYHLSGKVKNVFDCWIDVEIDGEWVRLTTPDGYYGNRDLIKNAMKRADSGDLFEYYIYGKSKAPTWKWDAILIKPKNKVTQFKLSPTLSNICGFGIDPVYYTTGQFGYFETFANVKDLYAILPGCAENHYVNGIGRPILGSITCTFDKNCKIKDMNIINTSICHLLPNINDMVLTINSAVFPEYVLDMMSFKSIMKIKLDMKYKN